MRHVIVTGGSRGLGSEFVRGLLEAGYQVSTCSRKKSEALAALLGEVEWKERLFWQNCAMGDALEVDKFIQEAVDWAGGELYGLVNNAGVAPEGVLATFPYAAMEDVIRTNLLGSMQAARAVLRVMLRGNGTGRIINISSIIGQRGYTGLAAYSATKAGMDAMTRSLAREVGRRGITVNSVAPGYLQTDMSSTLQESQRDQIVRRTPIGRLGTPADVLPVVKFLLSDESAFVTGQTLVVDGGLTC